MATEQLFDGKLVVSPGVYAKIEAEVEPNVPDVEFGKVLIIDTGRLGSGYGLGSGINGHFKQGIKSVKKDIRSPQEMQQYFKGGLWYKYANPLFIPSGGSRGVNEVMIARACTTTPSEVSLSFSNGDIAIKCKDEGVIGNAHTDETKARAVITITDIGSDTDVWSVTSDDGSGAVLIGSYTVVGTDDVDSVGASISESINNGSSGYSAVNIGGGVIWVYAPSNLGSSANSYIPDISSTGSGVATSDATFSGGVDYSNLLKGYAVFLEQGTLDTSKYVLTFVRGTFRGYDQNGYLINDISESDSVVEVVAKSTEVSTFDELVDWMQTNFEFGLYFSLASFSKSSDDAFTSTDLADFTDYQLFSGGTESYSDSDLDAVLDAIGELKYDFVLTDQYHSEGYSADNAKILYHIVNQATYYKFLWVAGGNNRTEFTTVSRMLASQFNTDRVVVVHGGIREASSKVSSGYKEYDSMYKTCAVLGRMCGQEPQVPLTDKTVSYLEDVHEMNPKELEVALRGGILCTRYDEDLESYVVHQGVNTLQGVRNKELLNSDGSSFSIQLKNIAAQLVKRYIVFMKQTVKSDQKGVNRNTLSEADMVSNTERFLAAQVATGSSDNIILKWDNLTISRKGDSYYTRFGFNANSEINKYFTVGVMNVL